MQPLPPPPAPQQGIPRPPPGSGGIANNKGMLAALAGCGCLGVLAVAGVMIAMVVMRRPAPQQAAPMVPGLVGSGGHDPMPSPPEDATGDVEQVAARYLIAVAESALAAARGEVGDPRFGSPHASSIPNVVALGEAPTVQLVQLRLGASAGSQYVRTSLVAFPDGRLRAAEAKLGGRPAGAAFDEGVGPELFAVIGHIGDDLLQRGQCPQLLDPAELTGLPQPLIAELTSELGESRIECQGLRPWPGFGDPWAPRADGMLIVVAGPSGPVLVDAELVPVRGILTPTRIREHRSR